MTHKSNVKIMYYCNFGKCPLSNTNFPYKVGLKNKPMLNSHIHKNNNLQYGV